MELVDLYNLITAAQNAADTHIDRAETEEQSEAWCKVVVKLGQARAALENAYGWDAVHGGKS